MKPVLQNPTLTVHPRRVPIRKGIDWFVQGFHLFCKTQGHCLAGVLISWLILMVLAAIPLVGIFMVPVLCPLFLAGFMLGADSLVNKQSFELEHIFSGFRHESAAQLWLMGLFCLLCVLGMTAVIALLYAASIVSISWDLWFSQYYYWMMLLWILGKLVLPLVLTLVLSIPIIMMCWFSPALIVLHNVRVLTAVRLSFIACLLNLLPYLLYCLILIVCVLLTVITLGLGLLVLIPVVIASIYLAYRDIFLH